MKKITLKSLAVTTIKNELKRLIKKYPNLDVDSLKLLSDDSLYSKRHRLEYRQLVLWIEGENLSNIEKFIQINAIYNSKIVGFGGKIICKLFKK